MNRNTYGYGTNTNKTKTLNQLHDEGNERRIIDREEERKKRSFMLYLLN